MRSRGICAGSSGGPASCGCRQAGDIVIWARRLPAEKLDKISSAEIAARGREFDIEAQDFWPPAGQSHVEAVAIPPVFAAC